MRDASIIAVRASRTPLRASVATLLLAAACALGGCAGNGAASGSFAMAGGDSPTIAFESIDGPPPPVFDRMVSVLDSETKLRSLAVVSRESAAAYRVRSYLSAQTVRGKAVNSAPCGLPARSRPARAAATLCVTPGLRLMTSCCEKSRRPD